MPKTVSSRAVVRRLRMGILAQQGAQKPQGAQGGASVQNIYNVSAYSLPMQTEGQQAPAIFNITGAMQQQGQAAAGRIEKKEHDSISFVPAQGAYTRRPPVTNRERERISVTYPLIPPKPKKGDIVYAYAAITEEGGERIYKVLEPTITGDDRLIVRNVKKRLEEVLDVDLSQTGRIEGENILLREIQKALGSLNIRLDKARESRIVYYIKNDTLGLGMIEALMNDPNIEDISCDGVSVSIFVYHRDPRIATIKTSIKFDNADELDSFIIKLAQKCNKSTSIAEPLLDGTLPDGSRVQATLGSDIARRGSNFTIRKFASDPLTPIHMMKYKTLDSLTLAYLWMAVEYNNSILISGGTATGKTSLLNALSLFIRPNLKVVSIEDTSELKLPHSHWIPHVARTPLSEGSKIGEVSLFDLLRASLRQRPDYIILGEVRGKEAYVLFQQMATGHASMATIHAASIPQLIDRLITPPINLPPRLLENIDIVVFLSLSSLQGSDVRRASKILEITGFEGDKPMYQDIFEWNPAKDAIEIKSPSTVMSRIGKKSAIKENEIQDEIFRRKKILEWMFENNVYDYRDFGKIVQTYYYDPERVMDLVFS